MCYFHYMLLPGNTRANSRASKLGTHLDFLLVYTSAGETESTTVAQGPPYKVNYSELYLGQDVYA